MKMNLLLIIFICLLVAKAIDGHHKGMVKQIVSLISLALSSLILVMIGMSISSYMKGEFLQLVIAFMVLTIIGIVHHILELLFISAKVVSKLPVVSWLDKLLGVVVGLAEVFLIFWTVYTFVMFMNLGVVSDVIMQFTRDSRILTWVYEHNYLAFLVETMTKSIGSNS